MNSKLYVGNLPFSTKEEQLEQIFSAYGQVKSVKIITDRETGRSKGFGFVEMTTDAEAEACVSNLDGKDAGGRNMKVNIAEDRPRTGGDRGGRSFNNRR